MPQISSTSLAPRKQPIQIKDDRSDDPYPSHPRTLPMYAKPCITAGLPPISAFIATVVSAFSITMILACVFALLLRVWTGSDVVRGAADRILVEGMLIVLMVGRMVGWVVLG